MISSSDILKASILIVDDQEANVSLLEQMLRGAGYVSIASTRDPHEVCELHRKNRYDLILLDLQMPGMDGFQVMEGLKEIETGRLSSCSRDYRPTGSQAARAESRGEGFRQQTVRSRGGIDAGSQHARSPPAAPGSKKETKERNIVWKIHPLPPVRADRALLRMVLVNLISNAVKFTGARAEAKIEIGCAPNGNGETVIFIRDNGAGFDPKYTEKLFGVFQRLHSQDEFEGTGIGLANVQRIIHRHGGRTWADGVVDGGATFYFSIPKQMEA